MTVLLTEPVAPGVPTHARWFARELAAVQLGDRRRTERVVRLVTALAAPPTGSLPTAPGAQPAPWQRGLLAWRPLPRRFNGLQRLSTA